MKIEEAVEWTFRKKGSLNREQLTALIYSNPYLSFKFSGKNEIEARIRHLINSDSKNESKYRFCSETNTWHLIETGIASRLESNLLMEMHSNREIHGNGQETVYVIYSPIQRFNSVQSNQDGSFPVKIGKTNRRSDIRLMELQTGNSMRLQVGIEFRTNDSALLENHFHKALSSKCMTAGNSSKEWFFTSFEEILNLYKLFRQLRVS